ncbi:MAG TPA: enoyl-CoA hydratase/isomerase family protein [Candidatus Dormibacteraeota bacterium]|jgi:enoyl-CoA hydratase/carnithine racemase|nr:enoyl-CoA hydratase/isomerase family protein [Candidatus Dormibacteraeota bacterium]
MTELVRADLDGDGLLTLTLNRPEKRNALSIELFAAIGEAFEKARDRAVRVVLLRAEGPVFCAGIDLSALAALGGGGGEGFRREGRRLQDTFMALERTGKPSVCAVRGAAVGAGLQLALGCDLRVVAGDARLGLWEIRYGIVPDLGGIHRLTRLAGPSRAKDVILTGREVSAEEALRMGVADRVVPAAEVDAVAEALAREVLGRSPVAVRQARELIDAAAAGQATEAALDAVLDAQLECMSSPDFAAAASMLAGRA